MIWPRIVIVLAALFVLFPVPFARGQVNSQAAALQEFQDRLNAYLKLRADLANRLEPLAPTANAVELAARQRALAMAMSQARRGAQRGDLIPAPVAKQIAATVTADLARRAPSDKRAAFEEVPARTRPVINRVYPQTAAMATVPPLLLNNLPRLPDNLQYRFMGRHIVILDGDTDLMIDYLVNVLPPLAQGDPDHQ